MSKHVEAAEQIAHLCTRPCRQLPLCRHTRRALDRRQENQSVLVVKQPIPEACKADNCTMQGSGAGRLGDGPGRSRFVPPAPWAADHSDEAVQGQAPRTQGEHPPHRSPLVRVLEKPVIQRIPALLNPVRYSAWIAFACFSAGVNAGAHAVLGVCGAVAAHQAVREPLGVSRRHAELTCKGSNIMHMSYVLLRQSCGTMLYSAVPLDDNTCAIVSHLYCREHAAYKAIKGV